MPCLLLVPSQARNVPIFRHWQDKTQEAPSENADAVAEKAVDDTDSLTTTTEEARKNALSKVADSLDKHQESKTPEEAKAVKELGAEAAKRMLNTAETQLQEAKAEMNKLEKNVKTGKITPQEAADAVGRTEGAIDTANVKGAMAHVVEENTNVETASNPKKF